MRTRLRIAGVTMAMSAMALGFGGIASASQDPVPRGPWETYNLCENMGDLGQEQGQWGETHCEGEHENWWIVDGADPA